MECGDSSSNVGCGTCLETTQKKISHSFRRVLGLRFSGVKIVTNYKVLTNIQGTPEDFTQLRMIKKSIKRKFKSFWKFGIMLFLCLMYTTTNFRLKRWPQTTFHSNQMVLSENFQERQINYDTLNEKGQQMFFIRNYFRLLNTPTGVCRKLARIGGSLVCSANDNMIRFRDGDKMICMDPEMKLLSSSNIEDCTVLSFGIFTDYSFDLSIRELNCQVHMFDVSNYDPMLNISHMTFHKIGIGPNSMHIYNPANNLTLEINTLDLILERLNLSSKFINVLKIDIEGGEWVVLNYLLTKTNLLVQTVGQIAIEVHYEFALLKVTEEENNVRKSFQRMIRILQELEQIGFRRIYYWDNVDSTLVKDEEGKSHKIAGELLLVNSNLYKKRPLNKFKS